jgi:GH15 family glucan-1,4-alpha-glucosidase
MLITTKGTQLPTRDDHKVRYRPIADYAIIGNTHTAALIASNGSLDWCCCPRFDSPAVFCKLLDAEKGGAFRIGPAQRHTSSRSYVETTNILTMTFSVDGGKFRLTDLMPVNDAPAAHDEQPGSGQTRILRRVEGLVGECEVEVEFFPSFDFGRAPHRIEILSDGVLARSDEASVFLHSPVPLHVDGRGGVYARFQIRAGEQLDFSAEYRLGVAECYSDPPDVSYYLSKTLDYWHNWASHCTYQGPYRELVLRSALVLKLLTYAPTGAIIAAPTTSLPEEIGGVRNWDYRFTWIRDSSLILHALMATGFHEEAHAFFGWLETLCIKCCGDLQIMYTVDGETELPEQTLDHLEGYRASRPVRIGNAAAGQKQLDIYGELLDAVAYCYQSMHMRPLRSEVWEILRFVADQAAARWQEPDAGIWEMRGGQQHHLYSKLQCWVALDRAIGMAERQQLPADLNYWRQTRDEIRNAILTDGYDEELEAFVQAFGVKALDAAALTIPLLGFLPAADARVRSTVAKIQEQLSSQGLVYRYLNEDGLPGGEATFALCSFWLVDNLAMAGRVDEARELFERIVSYGNDVGLFAEEFDPVSGQLLGNFPQGFTHLALIRSAVTLAQAEGN